MQDFKKLLVWQKAHALTLNIYHATEGFPKDELYGLTGQMRRSGASIPTNIAEGCGRSTNKELAQFCQIAMGSASELEYQLLLAHDLNLLNVTIYNRLNADVVEIKKMLGGFIRTLRNT